MEMKMTRQELLTNKAGAWTYAMGWADQGMTGARWLRKQAAEIKALYHTDGLWNPDAEIVYLYFAEAAEMAAACDCQTPSPASGAALRSMECPLHNDNPYPRED
jgi:hypothetical protein